MVYWYTGGLQTWLGPDKWKQPHGTYRDLVKAFKSTISITIAFVAIMPAAIGAILLFVVEPMMAIQPGTSNPNWIEPIISIIWFVGLSLVVKWAFWPRKPWYSIPTS